MDNFPEFHGFNKIARLSREIICTEKIDGTNGLIYIDENSNIFAGSRNRWLNEHSDNHGFYHWVIGNKEELLKLGKGYHYGELWGKGINRGYGLEEKRFSLFNTSRWTDDNVRPKCCYVVPILYDGEFDTERIARVLLALQETGSYASPGFTDPEGIIIYHTVANIYFKKTILNDEGKNENNNKTN